MWGQGGHSSGHGRHEGHRGHGNRHRCGKGLLNGRSSRSGYGWWHSYRLGHLFQPAVCLRWSALMGGTGCCMRGHCCRGRTGPVTPYKKTEPLEDFYKLTDYRDFYRQVQLIKTKQKNSNNNKTTVDVSGLTWLFLVHKLGTQLSTCQIV